MEESDVPEAVTAAVSAAIALDLTVSDAILLHKTNRLAIRLLPCDVLARVAPRTHHEGAGFEVEIARRLAETQSPVGVPDPRVAPRVYMHGGFAVTFWTYYEPVGPPDVAPADFAQALERMHAGMRQVDGTTPHFTDRVAEALRLVGDPAQSPALGDADRTLLVAALHDRTRAITDSGAHEQLLHGEPHAGNLLRTKDGLVFIDLETCCRGPVEFDVVHAPEEVSGHYPAVDPDLLRDCRVLSIALIASWRWDRRDRFPNGRQLGIDCTNLVRAAME